MTPALPTPLEPSALPAVQRAALAWHLRTILADADIQSAVEHGSVPAEVWRAFVRNELLDLIQGLEGAKRSLGATW
jgi:hypothetical protein